MKKNSKLFRARLRRALDLTVLAVLVLDEVMEEYSLSDKEFNSIREAHDSIASARDTIVRLTKPQRMVSAEAKEAGYGESEDEEIVKLADEYYDRVLIEECGMKEEEAHHCRISYIHGAKAMLERHTWKPSEEQMTALDEAAGIVRMFTQRGFHLTSLYNDLKKLNQQKSK